MREALVHECRIFTTPFVAVSFARVRGFHVLVPYEVNLHEGMSTAVSCWTDHVACVLRSRAGRPTLSAQGVLLKLYHSLDLHPQGLGSTLFVYEYDTRGSLYAFLEVQRRLPCYNGLGQYLRVHRVEPTCIYVPRYRTSCNLVMEYNKPFRRSEVGCNGTHTVLQLYVYSKLNLQTVV